MYTILILMILSLISLNSFLVYCIFRERIKYIEEILKELKERETITEKYSNLLKEFISLKKGEIIK